MKCKIRIGFFAIFLFLIIAITSAEYFFSLILSVYIHELGHILAAKIRKIKLSEMKLDIFGAVLYTQKHDFSYIDEILLCLGGPVANFISVMFCISAGYKGFFYLSSLAQGILNLLPVYGFDGGRILCALSAMFLGTKISDMICKITSFVILLFMWWISVYLLLRIGATLNLFVFSMIMFSKIFISKK